MGHSELSPSGADRWSVCPASVAATRNIVEERSSEPAAEGTVAHTIRELCLDLGFDAYNFIGYSFTEDGFTFTVDDDMAENIQPGIDEIREYEGQMFLEKWVNTTQWLGTDSDGNQQGGSLDCGIAGKDLIVISDLKFGRGVPVQAVDNKQQILYALAFYEQYARFVTKATKFLIIIDQPRNSAGGGYWRVTLDQLREHGEKLRIAAKATKDPNAQFNPTPDGCQWCPIANVVGRIGGCEAHHDYHAALIDAKFGDIDILDQLGLNWTPPNYVPRNVRSHIVQMRSSINRWLDRLYADEIQDLVDNGPANGMKAVLGKPGNRVHRSPEKSLAFMKARGLSDEQLFTKKLISPAQGEKALKLGAKKFPQSLIEQGEGKPIMVPVDDDRPSLTSIVDMFSEV